MPDILDVAQTELADCAERLNDSEKVTSHTCAYVGRDAEAAVRTLQMKMVNAAPGLKAKTDQLAEELTDHVDTLVSEGPLNSTEHAHDEDVEELRRIIDEALDLASELRDDDFDLEERRNWTTMSERFEAIGRAAYDHPDLMEEPLEELFKREQSLEPPMGRME